MLKWFFFFALVFSTLLKNINIVSTECGRNLNEAVRQWFDLRASRSTLCSVPFQKSNVLVSSAHREAQIHGTL